MRAVLDAHSGLVHDLNNALSLLTFAVSALPTGSQEAADIETAVDRVIAHSRRIPVVGALPDAPTEREVLESFAPFLAKIPVHGGVHLEIVGGDRPATDPAALLEGAVLALASTRCAAGETVTLELG